MLLHLFLKIGFNKFIISDLMNKKLLGNSELLEILIDSESFDKELNENNINAKRILKYSKYKLLNFITFPFITNIKEIQVIPQFIKKYNKNGDISRIEINTNSTRSTTVFGFKIEQIKYIGKILCNRPLKTYEINSLILVFIQAELNQTNSKNTHILITNNDLLLKNRVSFKKYTQLSQKIENHLDIMTINEAQEFIGLFLRKQNEYILSPAPYQYSLTKVVGIGICL